jgi:hypothetical protein
MEDSWPWQREFPHSLFAMLRIPLDLPSKCLDPIFRKLTPPRKDSPAGASCVAISLELYREIHPFADQLGTNLRKTVHVSTMRSLPGRYSSLMKMGRTAD